MPNQKGTKSKITTIDVYFNVFRDDHLELIYYIFASFPGKFTCHYPYVRFETLKFLANIEFIILQVCNLTN